MIGRVTKISLVLLALSASSTGLATNLLQVYQQALQNDTTYKGAQATYLSAKQNMPLALANLLPTIDITASYAKSTALPNHDWGTTYGATLSQPLISFAAFAGVSKANASIRGAVATYAGARQTLIQSTISAYLTVVQDAATVQYDKTYTDSLLQLLKQQKQKYKVGIIPITAVYQAQSNYDSQLATNISDQNTLNTDIELLSTITNHSYTSIKGVGAALPLHSPTPNNMQAWVHTALQQNLNIIGAKALVDVDHASVRVDYGSILPSLGITGSYSHIHFNSSHQNNTQSNHSYGLALNFPIFTGGTNFAQARQDALTGQADQQALLGTYRSTASSTRSNYMAILAAISGVHAAKQAYISASQSLKSVSAGYQVGTDTITDVLTAMSDKTKAQNAITSSQIDYLNAIVALKQEAGILNDRDVKAISKILNKTVALPNTEDTSMYQSNQADKAPMTDAQKQQKVNSSTDQTTIKTTANALNTIHQQEAAAASTTNTTYSIQLFISNSKTRAQSFIQNYVANNTNAYIKQHVNDNGQTYYTVMYGHYSSVQQATNEISMLPSNLQRLKPWVRKNS